MALKEYKTFTIDFDNTCVLEMFPMIGADVDNCIEVLTEMQDYGHNLILWTCRSNDLLLDAVNWFRDNDIYLIAVNDFNYNYSNFHLLKSYGCPRKVCGDYNIDDKDIGCPTRIQIYNNKEFVVVDWLKIRDILKSKNLL